MTIKNLWLLLSLLLGMSLPACDSPADDDDSAGDDDDSAGDDDDSAGDDDDSAGDDDADWHALLTYGSWNTDTTLATIALDGLAVSDNALGLAGSDWFTTTADGSPWIIGRTGTDSARRYDGLDFSAPTLEFSTGQGTNPNALAVCDGKIFITRFDSGTGNALAGGDVGIFDLATGGPLGRIDLSSFDPMGHGNPEPSDMVQVGDMLYVGLQRFDRISDPNGWWIADPVGKVVEIDCVTQSVTRDWDVGANPMIKGGPDGMIIVKHDAGVNVVMPAEDTVFDVAIDADLPVGTATVDAAASTLGAMHAVEVNWAANQIWCVDVDEGTSTMLLESDSRVWSLTAAPDGMIWALWVDHWGTTEVTEAAGIGVYDPATCTEMTTEWMTFASPPSELSFHNLGN